jgi:hypothetical protein
MQFPMQVSSSRDQSALDPRTSGQSSLPKKDSETSKGVYGSRRVVCRKTDSPQCVVPRPQTLDYRTVLDPYHRHSIYSSTISISLFNMASESPPPYTRPNQNLVFASSEEKLGALKEWAESKKYVTPGTDGTLPAMDRGAIACGALSGGGTT